MDGKDHRIPAQPNAGETFALIAEGNGWLAVDKPARMSIHNDPGEDLISRAAAWLAQTASVIERIRPDPAFGIAAVHRLDRDTSGVVLLACRPEVFRHFSSQFEARQVKKRYVAVLHGCLGETGTSGFWDFSLAAKAGGRRNPAGGGKRVECRTAWTVLAFSRRYTLAALLPATGRKHQIRRHAKLAGHPVAGDRRYGSSRSIRYLTESCGFDRLALHAESLNIRVPDMEDPVTVSSVVPPSFAALLSLDR